MEWVDQDMRVVFLVGARHPTRNGGDLEYFEMELSGDEVVKAAHDFGWDDLRAGRFVELGHYGDANEVVRIALHRETEWHDPHLLPLVPPPDRWYRRAVESAWSERRESD